MTYPSRRDILSKTKKTFLISVALLSGGCLGSNESSKTRITEIALINLDNQHHVLTLELLRDSELVYEETFQLKKSSEFGTDSNPAPVINRERLEKLGNYVVRCTLDNEKTIKHQLDSGKNGRNCVSLVVRITQRGEIIFPLIVENCN